MEKELDLFKDNPEIEGIFQIMDALFLEIRFNGYHIRLPQEIRPQTQIITGEQADIAITGSLRAIVGQIRPLVHRLAKLDPDYFDARLTVFLDGWPKDHPGENLIFFNYFKIFIEAQMDAILLGLNR